MQNLFLWKTSLIKKKSLFSKNFLDLTKLFAGGKHLDGGKIFFLWKTLLIGKKICLWKASLLLEKSFPVENFLDQENIGL